MYTVAETGHGACAGKMEGDTMPFSGGASTTARSYCRLCSRIRTYEIVSNTIKLVVFVGLCV